MEERKYWLEKDGTYIGPRDTATELARYCKEQRINMSGWRLRYLAASDVDTAHRLAQTGAS